jgi:hypothetical protein
MPRSVYVLLAVIVVLSILLAGCPAGEDEGGDIEMPPPDPTMDDPATGEPPEAAVDDAADEGGEEEMDEGAEGDGE